MPVNSSGTAYGFNSMRKERSEMKKKILIIAGIVVALTAVVLISLQVGNELLPDNKQPTPDNAILLENGKTEIGGIIKLGSYEQDGDLANGTEPVEWLVLADSDSKYTLISLKALDAVAFSTENAETTWESSYIRTWLNDSFLNTAFTDSERAAIQKMTLANPANPTYGTNGGNDTEDYVYLMSIDEYNSLLLGTGNAPCTPTAFAVSQGVKPNSKTGRQLCSWWLRTPGDELTRAAAFYNSAEAFYGSVVNTASNGVRPMITVRYALPTE